MGAKEVESFMEIGTSQVCVVRSKLSDRLYVVRKREFWRVSEGDK